jgi:hypothetical protein
MSEIWSTLSTMAESFQDQLADLVDLFGSNRRAAQFVGVTHSSFPTWLAGAVPSARTLQRIVDGSAVVKRLREHGLNNHQLVTELHSLWSELNARPAELVRAGAATAVLEAIAARNGTPPTSQTHLVDAPADLATALRALAAAAAGCANALAQESR